MVNAIQKLNFSAQSSSYISAQYFSGKKHLVWSPVHRENAAGSHVMPAGQISCEVELKVQNKTSGVKRTCLCWV